MAEETDIQWCGNDSQQPKIIAAERKSRNANIGWYAIQFQKAGSPLTHALPGAHMFGGFEFSPEHTGESSDVVARPTHDYLIGPDAALTILQSAKRRSVCVFGFNVQSENASVKPIVEIVCHLENDCKSRIVVTSDRFVGMSTVNSIASIHIRNKNPVGLFLRSFQFVSSVSSRRLRRRPVHDNCCFPYLFFHLSAASSERANRICVHCGNQNESRYREKAIGRIGYGKRNACKAESNPIRRDTSRQDASDTGRQYRQNDAQTNRTAGRHAKRLRPSETHQRFSSQRPRTSDETVTLTRVNDYFTRILSEQKK